MQTKGLRYYLLIYMPKTEDLIDFELYQYSKFSKDKYDKKL